MFKDKIVNIHFPDASGSDSYRRFEYQIACVFETLITLYEKNEDFLVLLDYLDDFVIVENSGKTNELISFCQAKTKSTGAFTLNMIVKNEWIKKQAKNYLDCLDLNVRNILVTNFGVKVGCRIVDSTSIVSLSNLKNSDNAVPLLRQIEETLNGKGDIKDFYLVRADLSLDGFGDQLKGKLSDFASKNKYSSLSNDSLQTIYIKIWNELSEKQKYVVSKDDQKDYKKIIEKKGMKYSQIKDIFRTALDIQLPSKGELSFFYSSNPFFIGDKTTIINFLDLFFDFRVDSAIYGAEILKECFLFIRERKNDVLQCVNAMDASKTIFTLLKKDETVNNTDFFKKYCLCISALLTYKAFN